MNRKDYLMTFYEALGDLPHNLKADAMSEYRDYFDNGVKQGKTEEEISESLGDPVALAYGVRQRWGRNGPAPKRRGNRFSKFAIGIVVLTLGAGILTNAFNKGGIGNMVFGIGPRYNIDELKEADLNGVNRIEIHVISSNTNLSTSGSDKVKARLTGHVMTTNPKAVPVLEAVQAGNVLSISEKRESPLISGFLSYNMKMDISIPESYRGEVVLDSVSGNFKTTGQNLKNLKLRLTSGNIILQDIVLEDDLEVSSTSGDFKAEGLKAGGNAKINSASGNLAIQNLTCRQIEMTNTSGDIKASDCKSGLFSVKTVSGGITLNELDGSAILKTTSGDIEVDSRAPKGQFSLSTVSGNINLKLPGNGFNLDAGTVSGRINCDFDLNNRSEGKRSLKGIFGSGEIPVTLKTTSGDIRITER
jgi:hypothetical protein